MRTFFYILFFSLGSGCIAQSGFINGYIITNKGDTVKGQVKDRKFPNSTTSWQKIDFIDSTGAKFSYTPEDIKEYGRRGKPRYKTLVIGVEARETFLEVSNVGAVILYSYYRGTWGGAGNAVNVQPDKKPSKEKAEFYLTVQNLPAHPNADKEKVECFLQLNNKPSSLMQWRPRDYKRTAKQFFSDYPELLELIENGTLDENDIFAIVKKYNDFKAGK